MKSPSAVQKKVLTWTLTLALLAGAWGLAKVTLPDDAAITPFPTVAELGEPTITRNLEVTITDVRVARQVTDAFGWTAEGTWLVVDVEAATVITQDGGSLGLAELTIADRTFSATERGTTFSRQRLVTGVARAGSLAFELPEDALTGQATLRLGLPSGAPLEVLLDDVVELSVELDELPVEAEVLLIENGWAG